MEKNHILVPGPSSATDGKCAQCLSAASWGVVGGSSNEEKLCCSEQETLFCANGSVLLCCARVQCSCPHTVHDQALAVLQVHTDKPVVLVCAGRRVHKNLYVCC